jgi:ATP-binding cassette subfamily C protein
MASLTADSTAHRNRRPIWHIAQAIPMRRNLLVFGSIVFAGLAEGIGIAALLPLIAVLGDEGSKTNALSRIILRGLDQLHLPHDPAVLLAIIAGGMLLKSGLTLLALRQVGGAVAEVGASMRLSLIDELLAARWGFYVRQPVGRFSHALSDEASRASSAYEALAQMLSQGTQALIYLTIAAVAAWQLALLSIVVSTIMLGTLSRLLTSARRSADKHGHRLQTMLGRLTDVLVGIKPMKAMARHARFNVLFLEDLKIIKRAARRQVFSHHTNRALQEPILALCLALGIYIALKVLKLPVGEVMVLSLLLAKTVATVGKTQQELQNIYRNESGYWSLHDTITEARAQREIDQGTRAPHFIHEVEFRGVNFAFENHLVLREASLRFAAGDIVALTGSSGAGKTTLVDLLLGLHTPNSGQILIDGVPLAELDVKRWRAMTGYVPQELMLFHDSVLMNVTLGESRFTRDDVEHALRQAGAWDFVCSLAQGMDTIAGERGTLFSGGQRQRIAVARALVHRPRLLILDEATSALDPATEALIVKNVCELARDHGLTVLSISHHPAWMKAADRVISLKGGQLTETLQTQAAPDIKISQPI